MKKLNFEEMEALNGGCNGFTWDDMWENIWFSLTPGLFSYVHTTWVNIGDDCWSGSGDMHT